MRRGKAIPSKSNNRAREAQGNMKLTIREIAVFGMLGSIMYASKLVMELLPNIHLLGVFVVAFTVVYRKKALYPIYT